MQKIFVDTLILEMTRRCNMSCAHCLRGEAQDLDITKEIIDLILDQVDGINDITFSGGEPTLAVPMIQYTIRKIIEKGMAVNSFYMATNGLIYSQELMNSLIEFYAYCIENYGMDDFYGGVALSRDRYHAEIPKKNLWRYQAYKFYDTSKDFSENERKRMILNEGRAIRNGLGERDVYITEGGFLPEIFVDGKQEMQINVEELYVSAKGDLLKECDLSYDSQEKQKKGNILTDKLLDVLLKGNERQIELVS